MFKLLLLILLTAYYSFKPEFLIAEKLPLNIAVILDLSGAGAGYSESLVNGIKLALSELSEADRKCLNFLYEDDQLNPRNTLAAFQKLSGTYKLDGAVTFSSGTSLALAPVSERAKVTLLGLASDAAVSKGKKYAFNFWATPETVTQLLYDEITRRNYKNYSQN